MANSYLDKTGLAHFWDSIKGKFIKKSGDSMTGQLEFSGTNSGILFTTGNTKGIEGATSPQTGAGVTSITNIRKPVNDYDVANKIYVDNTVNNKLVFYVTCTVNANNVISSPSATNAEITQAYENGDLVYLRLHNSAGTIKRELTDIQFSGNGSITFSGWQGTTEYVVTVTSANVWSYTTNSNIMTCVSNQGDMSSDKNTAFGKISCRKYSDGTCDFTIDFRVYACADTSSNHILSQAKIAALIGETNITFGASQIFCWKPDGSNIGSSSVNPTWGYTGLLAWSDSGGYTRIGRYHTTSASGAWAMAQINSGLFYGKMTVIGATYT